MPAPGEQHTISSVHPVANPFEEITPRLSEYTAQEIATLQSRLEKQLGPEYISSRSGPSGQKVHYIAAEKCIQLANEIFGFNGWSSTIKDIQVDFCDENPTTLKVSLGLSVIVRVTLRDGTFHEDIGYGHIENCKGKAPAFEKAKKEGTTDALKRALRNFGNVLGNCIYDKDYLAKVTKVKVAPRRWDVDNLHRHTAVKRGDTASHHELVKADARQVEDCSTFTSDMLDDEFGDFDEADFSVNADPETHPDEVALASTSVPTRQINVARPGLARFESTNKRESKPTRRPSTEAQLEGFAPGDTVMLGIRQPLKSLPMQETKSRVDPAIVAKGPAVIGNEPFAHSLSSGRVLNQPSRVDSSVVPTVQISGHVPLMIQDKSPDKSESDSLFLPPNEPVGAGFYSARVADKLPAITDNENAHMWPPENLPSFNLHGESPSIRRTPGVDHKRTKPMNRDLKPVPGDVQNNAAAPNNIHRAAFGLGLRDGVRKVGAPVSPSPITRGNSYKPPTMKRSIDQPGLIRVPLEDVRGNNGPETIVMDEIDAKRQKLNQL